MDLYKEFLVSVLSKETIRIDVPFLKFSPYEIVEIECYRLLKNIKEIRMTAYATLNAFKK